MSLPTLLVPGQLKCGDIKYNEKPIDFITNWITSRMPDHGNHKNGINNRILIINASTGSGKSTVLPVALVRLLRGTRLVSEYEGSGVICTQPRILTAIALANDVSAINSPWNGELILGETVGYITKARSMGNNAPLVFATIGILVSHFSNLTDLELITKFKIIIIDEAHERSIDLDLLLVMLKNFYTRNKDNRNLPFLLFTSATLDADMLMNYFDLENDNVIYVEGRTYPIIEHWPEIIEDNYIEWAGKIVKDIIKTDAIIEGQLKNDILIFVPGAQENKSMAEEMNKIITSADNAVVLTINSEVVNQQMSDYKMLFANSSMLNETYKRNINRRIIISTIIAETGLTINSLKHVIDCGWVRSQETYYPWNISGLLTRPAPKSRIHQRKGRVGRLFAGHFYPLYSKEVYDQLIDNQLPEITIKGMSRIFLAIIRIKQDEILFHGGDSQNVVAEFNANDTGLITPPNISMFLSTQLNAVSCGFVSPNTQLPLSSTVANKEFYFGYGLTELGRIVSKIERLPFEYSRIILSGHINETSLPDLIMIVALCEEYSTSADILFKRGRTKKGDPPAKMKAILKAAPQWMVKLSGQSDERKIYDFIVDYISDEFIEDLMICTHIMEQHVSIEKTTDYCNELKLHFNGIIEKIKKRDEIMDVFISNGLNPFAYNKNALALSGAETFRKTIINIKKCLYDGLKTNILELVKYDSSYAEYKNIWGLKVNIGMYRFHQSEPPKHVLYDHLQFMPSTTKEPITPLLYRYDVPRISVIDSYYNIDAGILMPNLAHE
jgi:HrpA-like RNA helicase